MKHKNQIKMGSAISYLSIVIGIVTGLLYTPWMVDRIGQSNYGLYTLATSVITFFMMDFGLGSAVTRFVAKYRAEGNQEGVNKIISLITKLYVFIDFIILAVLIIVFFFLESMYSSLTPAELDQFKILYLMIAGFNLIAFPFTTLNGILSAYEKFAQLKLCDLFNKLFVVLLVIVALNISNGVVWVVGANIVSSLVTMAIKYTIVHKTVPIKIHWKEQGKDLYRTLFNFTMWTTIVTIMQRFSNNMAPSILGITSGSTEIAVLSPAVTLEGYFYTVGAAVGGMFLPRVSKFIAEKREEEITTLMIKLGRYQVVVLGLIFIGFVCIGKDFMVLWMGPEYERSYYCTLLGIFPLIISSSLEIGNVTLLAKGILKYQALGMIMSSLIGLIVSFVLSYSYGAVGVSIGVSISALSRALYLGYVCHKKGNIDMGAFLKRVYVKAAIMYIAVALLGLVLPMIKLLGWIGLIVKAGVITITYILAVFVIYLSKQERTAVLKKLRLVRK